MSSYLIASTTYEDTNLSLKITDCEYRLFLVTIIIISLLAVFLCLFIYGFLTYARSHENEDKNEINTRKSGAGFNFNDERSVEIEFASTSSYSSAGRLMNNNDGRDGLTNNSSSEAGFFTNPLFSSK